MSDDVDDLDKAKNAADAPARAVEEIPQPVAEVEEEDFPLAEHPKLDEKALHGLAGDVVAACDPHTEAGKAPVLFHVLSMVGNAVGRGPYVRAAGGSRQHANIFVLVVGPTSSGRKGTSAEYPRQFITQADESWRCSGPGLSTGEGLIAGVADLTHEEVKDEVPKRDPRAYWLETEFGRTLRVSGRDGNSLFPVIQQGWEQGNLEVRTKKDPLTATNVHVSIVAHVAPDVLRTRLDALNTAEGFANRFLYCWSYRSKKLPDDEGLEEEAARSLVGRISRALVVGRAFGELKKDERARLLWRTAYDDLIQEKPGLLGTLTHRGVSQVLRLALIYALMDVAREIRREHLEAALALWGYSVDSVKYIFGTKTGNLIADRIYAECRAAYPETLTDADVYGIFHGHVRALDLLIAEDVLRNAGLVTRKASKSLGHGHGRSPGTWRASGP